MREDRITAKGKGEMITYWVALGAESDDDSLISDDTPDDLKPNHSGDEGSASEEEMDLDADIRAKDPLKPPKLVVSMSGYENKFGYTRNKRQSKTSRLIDWNVEILSRLLKHVIARRNALGLEYMPDEEVTFERAEGQTVLEEVREIITLPKFDASAAKRQEDPEKMELDEDVKEQLHKYVSTLAAMYRHNPL
jgi:hypothetical protein